MSRPDPELLPYERLLELCALHGIDEADTLKHRLEEWDRWNEEKGRAALDHLRRLAATDYGREP